VEASLPTKGTFDTWDANLTFTSPEVTTGIAEVRIQASIVATGSAEKMPTLKGDDFFDVEHNPVIAFKSTKILQSGPDTFQVDGDFAIRGVKRSQKLTLTVFDKETGSGTIKGTLYFDRRNYGIDPNIPFIRVADRVEVNVSLLARRTSGPPVAFTR
jgi:polyisoprenoid-binding protein YceI